MARYPIKYHATAPLRADGSMFGWLDCRRLSTYQAVEISAALRAWSRYSCSLQLARMPTGLYRLRSVRSGGAPPSAFAQSR